jgi:hypothetical protein
MSVIVDLLDFIDINIKDNIKEYHYMQLLNLVGKLNKENKVENEEERRCEIDEIIEDLEGDYNDIYGSY